MISNDKIIEKINIIRSSKDEYEIYLAQEEIFKEFLPVIEAIVKEYKNSKIQEEDLIQEASISLLKSIDEFYVTSNISFLDYAKENIKKAIKQEIDDQDEIDKISKYISNTLNFIIDTENKLYKSLKRKPTISEIINKLDMEKDEYIEMKKYAITSLELDSKYEDDKYIVSDLVSLKSNTNEDNSINEDIVESLELSLEMLSEREKDIISKHFGLYGNERMEIDELAFEYGISYEKMRQLIVHIVRKIKKEME